MPSALANQPASAKLSESLFQELDVATGPVRAMVIFDLTAAPGSQNSDPAKKKREDIAAIANAIKGQFGGSLGVSRGYGQVAALAVDINKATATALANRPDIKSLDLDQRLELSLVTAIPLLKMDQMHAITDPAGGIQGQGGKLAVIDSGVVTTVPDLTGAVSAEACFCLGCCVSGSNEAFGPGSAVDEFGHGTRVLGTAISRGVQAGIGPAPEATSVVAKVVASDGSMYMSDIIAALDWVADSHPDTDVVNLSLGTSLTYPGDCNGEASWLDVLEEAIDLVIANGTLVVASSGNGGVHTEMSAPACLSQVISVGATYTKSYATTIGYSSCSDALPVQDQFACFSNVSTSTDVMAPGAFIEAPNKDGSVNAVAGTSFSAPLVAGCLTQIMAAEPSAVHSVLKAALTQSDVLVSTASGDVPRLDCLAAYRSVRTVFYDSFEADE